MQIFLDHVNFDKNTKMSMSKKEELADNDFNTLLRITEEYLFNSIVENQKLSKDSNKWTSEDSIVQKMKNVDEDNK